MCCCSHGEDLIFFRGHLLVMSPRFYPESVDYIPKRITSGFTTELRFRPKNLDTNCFLLPHGSSATTAM